MKCILLLYVLIDDDDDSDWVRECECTLDPTLELSIWSTFDLLFPAGRTCEVAASYVGGGTATSNADSLTLILSMLLLAGVVRVF